MDEVWSVIAFVSSSGKLIRHNFIISYLSVNFDLLFLWKPNAMLSIPRDNFLKYKQQKETILFNRAHESALPYTVCC